MKNQIRPDFRPLGGLATVLDTSSMNPQTTEQSLSLVMGVTESICRGYRGAYIPRVFPTRVEYCSRSLQGW